MNSVNNKVVLITGSSIGFGRELAYLIAKEKGSLIITYYKDKKEGEITAEKCLSLGAKEVLLLHLNVMDDKSIKETVKKIISKFKKIDILVNNAGIFFWKPLSEHTYEEIELQLKTNLEGLIKMTNSCLPFIQEQIINISSIAGLKGYEKLSIYCASKFGVRGFSQSLAQELDKIRVICINPGSYGTRMNDYEGKSPTIAAEKMLKIIKDSTIKSGEERVI